MNNHNKAIHDFNPQIGDKVKDCRNRVGIIVDRDDDDVVMDDGFGCSVFHCLEPIDEDSTTSD